MKYVKKFNRVNEAFTFKTEKPTGRYKSFSSDHHIIKYDKKEVGSIESEKPFKIRLMVEKTDVITDNNPNCTWKWITLKKEFETLQEAKDFCNLHFEDIIKKYTLHKLE